MPLLVNKECTAAGALAQRGISALCWMNVMQGGFNVDRDKVIFIEVMPIKICCSYIL